MVKLIPSVLFCRLRPLRGGVGRLEVGVQRARHQEDVHRVGDRGLQGTGLLSFLFGTWLM